MADYSRIISGLSTKLDKLIELNVSLKQGKGELVSENSELKSQSNTQKARISELEEELRIARMANSINGSSDTNDSYNLKLKINEYVREIDKCIANLNK